MPILAFGDKLPSPYLERFNPNVGDAVVISLLAMQSLAVEYHWIDLPNGTKGKYRCCGGVCCSVFGTRRQTYNVPVWVYDKPDAVEGRLMLWELSPSLYNKVADLAAMYNLLEYDLLITKEQQGQGTRTNFTIVPDRKLRDLMPPEMKQTIAESVEGFFQYGEETIAQSITEQGYVQLLNENGYDFNTGTFAPVMQYGLPKGQFGAPKTATGFLPGNPRGTRIGGQFGAPQVGAIGSNGNYATPPVMTQAPTVGVNGKGYTAMAMSPSQPVSNAKATPVQTAPLTTGQPVVPQQTARPVVQPMASMGTAAPIAQPVNIPPQQTAVPPTNAAPAAMEVTMDELDSMLDE